MTAVRLLVVHSDPADLAVLATVVAANAFELRVLEPPGDLVTEALRYQPDAIVLDVKQRVGDGYALCKALKANHRAQAIPVILTGSLDGPEAHKLAFAAGCDDFVEKPFNRLVLAYRLHAFARLRRAWERRGRHSDRLLAVCRGFGEFLQLDEGELHALERHAHRTATTADDTGRAGRVFRLLEEFDAISRDFTYAKTFEAMRRETAIDADLLGRLERWIAGSQEQPQEVQP